MINNSASDHNDAQAVINQIVIEYMHDKKQKRAWRWVKRGMMIIIVLLLLYLIGSNYSEDVAIRSRPHVGYIDIKGTIFEKQSANSDNFMQGLHDAYANKALRALILRIDSPGGSPVQADYMYSAVRYYQHKFPKIKVYAVCVDVCASAAYYVAAAADEIYANPSSIVGSIGVVYNGFGFVDAMQKLGVTRRLQTAGRYKGMLDPFSAETPEEKQFLQAMLDSVHEQFIEKVKQGRGTRLKITNDIFSGLFWTGMQAQKLGLIDGFASSGQVAREIVKIEEVVDYTSEPSVMERMAKNIGTAMMDRLPEMLGIKAHFQ